MDVFTKTVSNPYLQELLSAPLAGEAWFDISKMCCWIIPPSASVGSNSSRSDYTSESWTC